MFQKSISRIGWKSIVQPWQDVDWLLFALPIGLTILGGVMIRSINLNHHVIDWWEHWVAGGTGLILALIISRCRYEGLLRWHWIVYGLVNLALILVMLIGTSANGAQSWITIGNFNVQPSEFAKLGSIITIAALLHSNTAASIPGVLRTLAIIAVPWGLVLAQPDLGSSLVFGAITLGMLYWGNANPGWLVLMISPIVSAILFNVFFSNWLIGIALGWVVLMGVIAWLTLPWPRVGAFGAMVVNLVAGELGQIAWGLLKDYQKDRLVLFLNPDKDPLGGGYHLIQSRIAIGAGEIFGRGLNQGTQTQLNFIPEQHTDFVFSAIGEELGFVGCALVLLGFWLICLRLVIIAQNAKDNFGSLIVIGVLSMIVFQVYVNIGMTIGISPVTGIPLPWLSYGRSAIIMNFMAIGLVQSVANYRQRFRF